MPALPQDFLSVVRQGRAVQRRGAVRATSPAAQGEKHQVQEVLSPLCHQPALDRSHAKGSRVIQGIRQ